MARKFKRCEYGVLQRTYDKWKATYDPKDLWLEGIAMRDGSKKIGRLNCRICRKLKETESLSCGDANCCVDFVDGKSQLAYPSIRKHQKCMYHVQAMENYIQVSADDNLLSNEVTIPNQDPIETEEIATETPPQESLSARDNTQNALPDSIELPVQVYEGENAIANGVPESSQGELQVCGNQPVTGTNVTVDYGVMYNNVNAHSVNTIVNQHMPQGQEVSLVSKTLKKTYSEMAFGVVLPWLDSDVINLADYFYKVDIIETVTGTDGRQIKQQPEPRKFEHIFGRVNGLKPTRIILQDNEDLLSSIALLQLCRSWSLMQGPATIFDIVIYLDGQQLATTSLYDLIVDRCRTNKVDDNVLYNVVSNNPKVLLILDGLPSGLSDGQRTALNGLLWSDSFEDTTVIICAPSSNFVRSRGTEHKGYYVACCSDKQCTKLIHLSHQAGDEAIQYILSSSPYMVSSKPQVIDEFWIKMRTYSFVMLQRPLFALLLMHVFLREEFPKMKNRTDLFKIIFERLIVDTVNSDAPNLYSFDKNSIPREAQMLSRVGEFVLETLTDSDSRLSVESLKEHFQDDPIPVLKFGFVILRFQCGNESQVEKLRLAHPKIFEFMIAYHLWMVWKTQSTELLLEEVDRLNAIQPMLDDSCMFVCDCLADLLEDDLEEVYFCLRSKRPQYQYLVETLDIKVQRQKNFVYVPVLDRYLW